MTVRDVVSWLSGTSVRVAVTTIGGRLSTGVGSAAREKVGSKMKSRTTKTKTIILSFSRERGTLSRSDRSPGSGFKPTRRAFPPNQRQKDKGSRMSFSFILLPFSFILGFRQWLVRAAFVALTVAGQQRHFTSFPQSACSQFLSLQCEHPSFFQVQNLSKGQ